MSVVETGGRRRAGRPPRRVLTREGITAAALKLTAGEGYAGLTMAALARSLRVAPSALYNHVSSKQDVLIWIEEHVMQMVDHSAFDGGDWAEAVRRWAWSYRDVFARHTPLIPIIAVLPVRGAPQTLAMYEAVAAGFAKAGWPEAHIVPAIVALESFIFGSAFDATAPEDIFDTPDDADNHPVFATAVRRREEMNGNPADAAFRLGLEALISGLAAEAGVTGEPAQK